MKDEIGVFKDDNDEYKAYYAHHSDCFKWVKRDSYLPAGSHGLKAVTTSKLGYNPIELDPELMVQYAQEKPQALAQYSVSDAVATYYLYLKYVHPFIFSLCNIIPMNPDEVLRKGSGTLCESLLMVQAHKAQVIMPNKHADDTGKFFEGHLLVSETYTGGHVEALEAGVFRSDIPTKFKVDPGTVSKLMNDVERALRFTIETEHRISVSEISNFDEIKDEIMSALRKLKETPNRIECPLIYHLDVAAMYPNIILTNRLQPDAMVTEADCAACDYNSPENKCQRPLEWKWRGEYYPASRGEYTMVAAQLKTEVGWNQMPYADKQQALAKRLGEYSRKIYKKMYERKEILKVSTVCQRENPFYINTVRNFRDRRYEYKSLLKVWKGKLEVSQAASDTAGIAEAQKMVIVMDSLQLAHKCILNSFYGYVMRKGSRWFSMEMGGIVCYTGAKIIQLARELVEQVGRPLELDTDGIWCILPKSFPENFVCKTFSGKKIVVSYPCTMLNHLVHDTFTNDQYQTRDNENLPFEVKRENSIFFEVDGPYRAMILPASTEEDKLLKKRYAVFNDDGSLAELKGFEVKRRGELKMIKIFQQQIFGVFLKGKTLEECYAAVASVANEFLDILYTKGSSITDSEVLDLIGENKNMSKSLSAYEGQKSTAITTAKRLAEFLGNEMIKDKLACHFIIARKPADAPVAERAVPVAILHADPTTKRYFLRKWLKDNTLEDPDIREFIDWEYYKERFGGVLQKLISIPAAMQRIPNPVPRIQHPDWLRNRVSDEKNQSRLTDLFDIEDMKAAGQRAAAVPKPGPSMPRVSRVLKQRRKKTATELLEDLKLFLTTNKCPNPNKDYPSWLAFQKKKWKYQNLASKSGSSAAFIQGISRISSADRDAQHMETFLRQHRNQLEGNKWHIVQVKEEASSHIFWVFVSGKLHKLTIDIPRVFFVNSLVPISKSQTEILSGVEMTEAKKILPRGCSAEYFYQCTVSEDIYRRKERQFAQFFAHPLVQGVYETKVSGTTRAIINLGCVAKVNRISLASSKNIDWKELQPGPQMEYLLEAEMDELHLYHSTFGDRHFAVVHCSKVEVPAYIFISDPSGKLNLGNVPALYSSFSSKYIDLPNLEFKVSMFRSESQMLSSISKAISSFHQKRAAPTILIVQSNNPVAVDVLKSLDLYPTLHRSAFSADTDFPALDWQRFAFKRWIEQFVTFDSWKVAQLEISRFSGIPIGNLRGDQQILMLDTMLSRKLSKAGYILWYSLGKRPDLGGREYDEHYSVLDVHMTFPEVNSPGFYNCISVDMEVLGLCVASLLEMTKSDVSPLIALVKELTMQAAEQNHIANDLLMHCYRWITAPSAALYDPYITSSVYNQMKRMFMSLVNEIRKLNVEILYASFNRFVVQTPKSKTVQAKAFIKFLLNHLGEIQQFSVLQVLPQKMWTQLCWMDPFNFGGFRHTFDTDSELVIESLPSSTQQSNVQLSMKWNLSEFLPEPMVPKFMEILSSYFIGCHDYREKHGASTLGKGKSESEVLFKRSLIQECKQKMFYVVPKLHRNEHGMNGLKFPYHPGSCKEMESPTLEFVKYISTILSLDEDVEDAVRIMRRNVLDLISIREFSNSAEYSNPCLPLVLYQVACTFCGASRDLDLTRDPSLREDWRCSDCGESFPKAHIEDRLIESIECTLLAHQVQDLVCTKCKVVKRENLNSYCPCSGEYVLTHNPEIFERRLQVVQNIALHHSMGLLREICEYTQGLLKK
jgi:DNA polymerase epsilon subunit 1